MQFVGTNAVFAVGRQPHCGQPLIKTNRGILKDSADLCRILLFRVRRPALPNLCVFKERHLIRSTAWATHSARPAHADKELKSILWIAEIRDRFEQGVRYVHAPNLPE